MMSPDIGLSDGFTAEEVENVLHPPATSWSPIHGYEKIKIDALEPGPKFITFMGRIVNLYNISKSSKRERTAKGFFKLTVADDSGTVMVFIFICYPFQGETEDGRLSSGMPKLSIDFTWVSL